VRIAQRNFLETAMNMHFKPERPFSLAAHLQMPGPRHRAVGGTIRGGGRWLAASIRRRYRSFAAWLVRRHLARDLQSLDDRTLADIGIARSDIVAMVNDACGYRIRGDNC
jgi:uncharacterized protein YjiS (DUF1127 family)